MLADTSSRGAYWLAYWNTHADITTLHLRIRRYKQTGPYAPYMAVPYLSRHVNALLTGASAAIANKPCDGANH